MNWLDANWFPLIVAVILIGMMLYGHDRGFVRIAVSMGALVLTVILVRVMLPHVTTFIREHTAIESVVRQKLIDSAEMAHLDEAPSGSWDEQKEAILGLDLPDNVKQLLEKNNTELMWEELGASRFVEYVIGYLCKLIVGCISFVVLFIVVWILLHILMGVLDIFTRLPIIHGLNQIFGAVLGLTEGLVFVWIGFVVLGCFSSTETGRQILAMIRNTGWLSFLYKNNILLSLISHALIP